MYRSLYFKIILIFVIFMVTVMAVVGTFLLNSVFSFYTSEFAGQMEEYFEGSINLRQKLLNAMSDDDFSHVQKEILSAYSSMLGIDVYRNFYVLDKNGGFLDGSNEELGNKLIKTPNLISAMNGSDGVKQLPGTEYSDYALYLEDTSNERECIIYIKDTQEEMRQLSYQLFSIVLQSVLFGLIIAVILSFFLAKAITSPIQSLTRGAQLITAGEFTHELDVHGTDEIGTLTVTFNKMKQTLKNTLDEVSGERSKLETILSYLKDSVIAFSDYGSVIHINTSALELFGDMYSDDFTLMEMLDMLSLSYEQGEKSYSFRDVVFNEKALDVNISALKYMENNSVHNGCIAVLHDITSRYELDKARREFVANVSHELRTPLTVIKSSNETVLMYPDMDDEMRTNFLSCAIEESDRMLRIIGDLLTLSRLDNKRTKWQISKFSIADSLKHRCDLLRSNAEAKAQQLIYEQDAYVPDINGDKERIEQVLINIITNSIKYTQEGGTITARILPVDSDRVQVRIRDNGIGIPEEDVPRLFERFYRVEKSRTSDSGGTGLGLAIAKEIVDAHGGNIYIKSKLGKGTETVIEFPVETGLENDETN